MKSTRPAYPHLGYLDSLRALAAMYVVVHHVIFYLWPPWSTPPHTLAIRFGIDAFYFGRCAVAVFIVLSGYCLSLPVFGRNPIELRGGVSGFLRRRARRILPPYYATLLLSGLFILATGTSRTETLWDESIRVTWPGAIAHLLAVQDWFGKWTIGQFNYVLWSVAVEWHIYFLFPVLLLGWKSRRPLIGIACVFALSLAAGWLARHSAFTHFNFAFIGLFALGMAACSIVSRARLSAPGWNAVTGIAFGAALAWFGWSLHRGWNFYADTLPVSDAVTGIATAALLIALGNAPAHPVRRLLEAPALVRIGEFSYSIYLVHAVAIQAVWLLGAKGLHLSYFPLCALLLGVAPLFSLGVARVFHIWFERPFMNTRPGSGAPAARRSVESPAIGVS